MSDVILQKLASECAEVIHIITKIEMFGQVSFNPDDPNHTPNLVLLQKELGDLLASIQFAMYAGYCSPPQLQGDLLNSCKKVITYHPSFSRLHEAALAVLRNGITSI